MTTDAVAKKNKRVTATDVARSLGLSRATVGFVLNNTPGQTIPEQTRNRVLAEAERMGYRPHAAARALASGRTRIVLAVLPDWPQDYNLRRNLEEASTVLDEAGYTLITYTAHPTGKARPLWEILDPDVVLSMTGGFSESQLTSLRAARVRVLIPDPDQDALPAFPEDGPRLQISHLFALGHRRIAFAGATDPRLADLVDRRRESASATAAALDLPSLETADLDLSEDAASRLIGKWRRRGVSAIACYNDDVAASIVGAAIRQGVDVPGELSVIGLDDAPFASMFVPRLSTVRIDATGLGRHMAHLAISAAENDPLPQDLPPMTLTLVERDTTAAPRNA